MLNDGLTRRTLLSTAGTVLLSAWAAADPAGLNASLMHAVRSRQRVSAPTWEFFSPEQAADMDMITAQIMPTDETAGAREAGVVGFIDHSLATWAALQRETFIEGLDDLTRRVRKRWPDAGRFAALSPGDQAALLRSVEQTPFFQAVRFATLLGMFSLPSYGGNAGKVGWQLIGFEDRHSWQPPFGYYDAEAAREGS